MKISIILAIAMSLLFTSCVCNPPNPPFSEEHLYLWKSTGNENALFFLSTMDDNPRFDSSSQSITEYIIEEREMHSDLFGAYVGVFSGYSSINTIKKLGFWLGGEYVKHLGYLHKGTSGPVDNEKFNTLEMDKSKIEYYPISIFYPVAYSGEEYTVYLRQDSVFSDNLDVLVIIVTDNSIVFQHSFEPNPEYVYLPERDGKGDPWTD